MTNLPDTSSSRWIGGGSIILTASANQGDHPNQFQSQDGDISPSDTLPDIIRIPFEEAVQGMKLDGWEDEWFSSGRFDARNNGPLAEPKIDFIYNWVNGTENAFKDIRHQYELVSPLNDAAGKWISQHSINRYRDWGELRYSLRSVDLYANGFINKIQILVNSVGYNSSSTATIPQRPTWLRDDDPTNDDIQILSQEMFFHGQEKRCLPTFNSLSIESQIHNTPSSTDQFIALSDDMFLGMPHAPSDFYSPLFGSMMGFKADHYNVKNLGSKDSWPSFGEKPFVYYTSYLLNRRFGMRDRHVQAHFSHSVSRAVMKEAMASFPRPSSKAACERFRGESHFQIYPWFASFHYSIERFREALLWSFIMVRSDINQDGYLDWTERELIIRAIDEGRKKFPFQDASTPATQSSLRDRIYYQVPEILKKAGLQPPKVNIDIQWTSLDGPATIRNIKCNSLSIDKCFANSFASPLSDTVNRNSDFTASNVFSSLSHQHPDCGDCLLKFLLASTPRGLEPLLPPKSKPHDREVIVKALKKYQHTIIGTDTMKFVSK